MAIVVGAALAAGAAPALAINSYNAEPAPERTEVGAFVALWDRGSDGTYDRFDWVCSGAMIDDDTFLTAAHCTNDWPQTPETPPRFFVSLVQDLQSLLDDATGTPEEQVAAFLAAGYIVEGTAIGHPDFPGTAAESYDIGVIDFADWETTPADVWEFTPATLPTEGLLGELGSRALDALDWWAVGYGTEEAVNGAGGQTHPGGGVRMKAPLDFNALNKTWVRLAMIEARGLGGACYGDSGGPNFVVIDGVWILAATTITGDVPCYATNVAYRVDTATAREFLDDFVALP
jgi:hypothetical protein